ncbi:uncharacterized protein LOC115750300 [Rhodamnia argentea]|uniref:Uncharacterized protein LOC115750300 n=1 Tax=Rhodamnia argentea TaxID=178133 RepID=A0A8B8Q8I8_9MYRT|nr:uncharacterized protein LOC115750300 [Rhodamnia argentea]
MASTSHKEAFVAKWTEPLSNLLVSLLVEEVKKGNRTTSTYNKAGWKNIHAEFNKQTGFPYTLVQVKNRVNKPRKLYMSFKKLLSQTGFGWDNVNKRWLWMIRVYGRLMSSDRAKFKNEGFPHYPDLCIVFGDTHATGDYVAGNAQDRVVSEGADNGGDDNIGDAIGDPKQFNEHQVDDGVFTPDVAATLVHEKHKLDRTPNSKRRRKSNTFDVNTCCKAIHDMIKFKTSQSTTSGSVTSHATSPVDPYSIAAVIAVLNGMPDLEQNL